jgi:dynein heavy chain, axonemal
VTPKTYLELIDYFKKSLQKNSDNNKNNIHRYVKGLEKLNSAKEEVETKKAELEILQPQLVTASKEIDVLIINVQKEQVIADAKKIECEAEEIECNIERDKANILKDDCKIEVEKLEPLLISALKNLDAVKREDIDFIKSTKTPGASLVSLFKALCILYGFREGKEVKLIKDEKNPFEKYPDYFDCARKFIMNKPKTMLDSLKSYDETKINEMDVNIIKKWVDMVKNDDAFDGPKLTRVSEASGKLYDWVNCIIKVYENLQLINPKREALAKAEATLKSAETKLAITMANLQGVIDKIMDLKKGL